ncbi:glycosyl transferase [Pseudozyma hubeiensis SY62]|uniref:Glycosyl transferase n=1 Tax=Pseudozyma hubeiensis (strain SY62) TaxID=1305764 RepID=R9NW10_PSEHS|nr:glycosyl transferase [Pseudozyma hubeiensis SY62]GAC92679.1 glycosyl transferase [Pseudozyma hubeiensis SY62]
MAGSLLPKMLRQASAWYYGWTPMIMLICYSMLSFFFYLLIPAGLHRAIWYSLVALQTFTALSVSTEAMQSIRPSINARKAWRHAKVHGFKLDEGQEWPFIDVVLVAYLPNEQEIIMRQVKYALRELNYPKHRMTINVCYNTPYPIEPVETELRDLAKERSNLRIIKVPKSTSKADNINHFLTLEGKGEIITLYDTDHYPEPDALRWVAKRFMQGGVDIIQGRCCIYNYSETFMTKLIASEFDLIYGVMHSGRAEIQGYGFFGGSNGHWNASLLRTLGMQKHMLTEDIDSSMRAIISGARIEYDLKVLSYELAPETLPALVKQRLRWAQGWTQVAFRHAMPSIRRGAYSDNNGWRSRVGLFQLLLYREFYFYINSQLVFMLASGICYNIPTQGLTRYFEDFGGYALSMFALAVNLICLGLTVCIQARNRSHFTGMGGIILFALCTPIWYSVTSLMAIFCHFREFIKFEKWNPTARTSKNTSTANSLATSQAQSEAVSKRNSAA